MNLRANRRTIFDNSELKKIYKSETDPMSYERLQTYIDLNKKDINYKPRVSDEVEELTDDGLIIIRKRYCVYQSSNGSKAEIVISNFLENKGYSKDVYSVVSAEHLSDSELTKLGIGKERKSTVKQK